MKIRERGFTLLEFILILMIVGILSIAAVSQMPDMAVIRLDMAARKVQSDIRYAQSLAVSAQRWTRIVFSAASDNYSIYTDGIDDGVSNPSGWSFAKDPLTKDDYTVQFNTGDFVGVDVNAVNFNGANNQLVFDKWGNPYSYIGSGAPAVLTNPAYVRLTTSAGTKDIRVERGTGRAYIQ